MSLIFSNFEAKQNQNYMTNQADISRYMGLAREALGATGAKLRKNFVCVFIEVMFLYVSVRKINNDYPHLSVTTSSPNGNCQNVSVHVGNYFM